MPTITAQARNKPSLLPNIIAFPRTPPRRRPARHPRARPAPAMARRHPPGRRAERNRPRRPASLDGNGAATATAASTSSRATTATDHASFALLYPPGSQWSSWGLARADNAIEVWSCSNGQTLGRFPTMPAALASLPRIPAQT